MKNKRRIVFQGTFKIPIDREKGWFIYAFDPIYLHKVLIGIEHE